MPPSPFLLLEHNILLPRCLHLLLPTGTRERERKREIAGVLTTSSAMHCLVLFCFARTLPTGTKLGMKTGKVWEKGTSITSHHIRTRSIGGRDHTKAFTHKVGWALGLGRLGQVRAGWFGSGRVGRAGHQVGAHTPHARVSCLAGFLAFLSFRHFVILFCYFRSSRELGVYLVAGILFLFFLVFFFVAVFLSFCLDRIFFATNYLIGSDMEGVWERGYYQ